MKKRMLLAVTGVFAIAALLSTWTDYSRAAGLLPPIVFTASGNSQVANGSSKITFTTAIYKWTCANGYTSYDGVCSDGSVGVKSGVPNYKVTIYTSSTGNIFGQTAGSWPNGRPYVVTGADGTAQFTLASSVAESKKLTASHGEGDGEYGGSPSLTVSFTAPPVAAAPKPAPQPAPAPKVVATPETPKVALKVDGKAFTASQPVPIKTDKPFTLAGTTVPNGVVKLYIFSTPREATVTADDKGNWSYAIKDLEPGQHHVEAEVTDPATQKTSPRATIATLAVAAAKATTVAKATEVKPKNNSVWYIAAALVVMAAGGGAYWWFIWRKRNHPSAPIDLG